MARKYRNAFRIVTLDGQVINRGGSMTGGSTSRSGGVLSRSAELEQLTARTAAMQAKLAEAKQAEEDTARELAAAQYELETAEAQRRHAEDEVLRLEGIRGQYDLLLRSLEESVENLAGELESLAGRLTDNDARSAAAQVEINRQESAAADARAQAEAALSGQSELLEKSGALAEEISGRKSDLAALAAEREATVRSAADLRALCADLSGDREQKEQMAETYRRNIAAAEEEIAGLQTALEELAGRGAAFRQRLAAITEEKNALEAERTAKNRAGQEMNENLLNLERAVAKLDQKRATSAMEEKQILDRLGEHYELSHSDAQAQRIELESVPKANRRIGELKRDITALGTPNIGAIDEFQRVNTRYTYLTDQRNDVEKAKGELQNIIGEITEEMTKIFAEQAAVRELPDHLPGALRGRDGQIGTGGRGGHPGLRHRDQGPAAGKDPQDHLPAVRRREGLCGHRAVFLHSESPSNALLRDGRDRGGPG